MTATVSAGPGSVPLDRGQRWYLPCKRGCDLLAAGCALLVLSPLLLLIAGLVLLVLGAPVTFVQDRVTQDGRIFRLRKFRTMHQIDPARGLLTDEQRMTRFGRRLRSSSLDELPSLWNILVGDMSVIGPRPLLPEYLPLYSPEQLARHRVRAGLTGLAQVSGRNRVPWDARLELDHRYILLLGPLTDLLILLRTVITVLGRHGITGEDHVTSADFPGPLRTPRLRFVSAAPDEWIAVTPAGTPISRCVLQQTGESSARLTLCRLPGVHDEVLVAESLSLLVNRVRACELDRAIACVPTADVELLTLFTRAGFTALDDSVNDDDSVDDADAGPGAHGHVRLGLRVCHSDPSHASSESGASR